LVSALPFFYLTSRKEFQKPSQTLVNDINRLDPNILVEDKRTFYVVIIGLMVLVAGFIFGGFLELKAAEIALFIAAGLLLFSGMHPKEIFEDVEWISVYFIIGLFILVGSIEILGILTILGEILTPFLQLPLLFSLPFITFGIGMLSAIVDNIPISAALAPVFSDLYVQGIIGNIHWWALVIAVNLGGYILPIGSPANILAINLSNREGSPISFIQFLKIGAPLGFFHLLIGTSYLIIISMFI
jgi:Na+/H+ antiporter NhaD/arsenite permease-like protein